MDCISNNLILKLPIDGTGTVTITKTDVDLNN